MTAATFSTLVAQSMVTHHGDCVIAGDVGAGSSIRVTGGSLTIHGNVGRYSDIVVLQAPADGFDVAWHAFLSVPAEGDLAVRRAGGQALRAAFQGASGKGLSIGGTVGASVRIACDGDVRFGGAVGEHARVVAQGDIRAPSIGMQGSLTAGKTASVDRVGVLCTVWAQQRAMVRLVETRSEICAGRIEGARRRTVPAQCPQGGQDRYPGVQAGYFYSGDGRVRLLRL